MYWTNAKMSARKVILSMTALCLAVLGLIAGAQFNSTDASTSVLTSSAAASPAVIFTNSTQITIADAGTGTPYPSTIAVAGLGTITDVNVRLNGVTHTFPDDIDVLLVSPAGTALVIQSDAGGGGDITNRTYTFDQSAAAQISDSLSPAEGASVRPGNYTGNDGAVDVFPAPAPAGPYRNPGPQAGGTVGDLTAFNGQAANGTWSLYVTDDEAFDTGSITGGWTLDITAVGTPIASDAPVDFNGDGRSDYVVVRNIGGGASGQIRWFYNLSSGGPTVAFDWGLAGDFFISEDFDNDNKDDIAVWRPGAATVAAFYIHNSATNTARVEAFGQTGDDPTIVDDYNNDGSADLAVYRAGVSPGQQSTWFYRTVAGGPIAYVPWGINGDFPAPGDYDGDGSADFVVQRNQSGAGVFYTRLATGAQFVTHFGLASDLIVPGDYDADGKTDIAVVRGSGGSILWFYEPSGTAGVTAVQNTWGNSATDFLTQGDYDGDGRTDLAIWRSGVFWIYSLQGGGITTFNLGSAGDYPVANYNSH